MRSATFSHPTEPKAASYGQDHACGWFVMIWDTSEYSEPDSENVLIDADQFGGEVSGPSDVLRILEENGFGDAARDLVGV